MVLILTIGNREKCKLNYARKTENIYLSSNENKGIQQYNILRFFDVSGWSAGLADKSFMLLHRPNELKRPKTKVKSSPKDLTEPRAQHQPAKPQWLGYYRCVLSCLRRGSRQLTSVYKVILHIPQIFLHPVVSDWAFHRIYRKLLTTNKHPKLYIHLKWLHGKNVLLCCLFCWVFNLYGFW